MKKIIISALLCSLSFTLTNAQKVNINCPEGANWQKQKRASVKLGWGSASLINNGDGKIYLLTARHCMYNEPMLENSTWQLTFGEEYTTCNGTTTGTSVTADVVIKPVARSYTRDYALAEVVTDLSTIPGLDLSQIYINGYDRTETAPTSGTYIGFPGLEKKRIGTYNTAVNPNVQYFPDTGVLGTALIRTQSGYQGVVGGASGSPVFDQNGRTKATLYASNGDSSALVDGSIQAWNATLAGAWTHGENEPGGTKLGRTMQAALDPENTSLPYTNGIELTEMRRLVNGPKYLVNKKTGYAVGIRNGRDLIQDTQSFGEINKYTITTENGYYKIQETSSNAYLIANPSTAGTQLRKAPKMYYPNENLQQFRILPTGNGDNSYYIQNIKAGLNLAVDGSSNISGAKIVLGTQSGNAYEEWYITDVPPAARIAGTQSREMQDSSSSISVYPVPAVDYLSVKVSSDKKVKAVSVVNTMGREVFRTEQISLEGQSVKIDVQKLMTGNYMVNVVFTDGSQSSAKFLKK